MEAFEEEVERGLALRVGVFVAVLLAMGMAAVLLLSSQRHVLHRRVLLSARFADVQGLREGAPVRLAGVNVGTVARLRFSPEHDAPEVLVTLEIGVDALHRIGPDSVARIGSQGLLGDKIIDISVSPGGAPHLSPGATIPSVAPPDINLLIERTGRVIEQTQRVAEGAAAALEPLSRPAVRNDIESSLRSLRLLLAQAEHGHGLAHTMFYDPRPARELSSAIENSGKLVARLELTARRADALLASIDGEAPRLVSNLSRAAAGLADVAAGLHAASVGKHLEEASADLSQITAQVKSGHGTVGALLMDPTVYEQLVTVLGGAARSRILRAAVRYAISRSDDDRAAGRVIDGKVAPSVAPAPPPPPPAPTTRP